ncbi:hypothetical protein I3843_01G128200 [Carya illinoinensis]|uniref:Uncharacterized protein n=1 Tax=Carya illinoinensis TaxID=32201 RepID=A0A8T1RNX1_CARIL|nr:hypothetical protein I3760_01G132300 [Carya illinoinensis]KAG6667963.1 hypothetical protein CIPAW_01G136900 [Carya illinoinensis]KAG6731571.1 hypothetical protein I3842_01G135300 [Carya illinoinensis]KAG7995810.1 hypothetical protein I3843_01G128200 [Carya illinoinensis]
MTMKTLLVLFVAFLPILATLQTNAETHVTVQANYVHQLSRTESTPGRKVNGGASHDSVNNDVVAASAETTAVANSTDTVDTDHEANPSYRGNINGTNSPSSSNTHHFFSDDRKPHRN